MKITHYKLIAERTESIEDKMTELIAAGWQPFGPPFVLPPTADMEPVETVFQAVVKYADS